MGFPRKPSEISATKKAGRFVQKSKLEQEEQKDPFHHAVLRVTKEAPATPDEIENLPQKFKNIWYMKKEGDASRALCEVLAQEFFRLLIPGQPKTRLAQSEEETYILSKQVEGFKSLGDIFDEEYDFKEMILEGKLKGMGDVVVIALLMNEIDLKAGNMGRDKNNRVVKIDGDYCFSRLVMDDYRTKRFDITSQGITQLPYVDSKEYYFSNWFTNYVRETTDPASIQALRDAQDRIAVDPPFRLEVNSALLRAMLLPDELIQKFILRYIPESELSQSLYDEMILRRDRLMYAAIQNDSFQDYLKSPEAEKQVEDYIAYLRNFNTTSKNNILGSTPAERKKSEKNIRAQFEKFKKLNDKIRSDPDNFKQLDAIAYPILNLLHAPGSSIFQRQVLDQLKAAAREAYDIGHSKGYSEGLAFAKANIIDRIGNVDRFIALYNTSLKILALEDHEPGMGWDARQVFIKQLKGFANVPYHMILDGEMRGSFDPDIALSYIQKRIGMLFKSNADLFAVIDKFTVFDKYARHFIEFSDFPEFKERQEIVIAFKKCGHDFYQSLNYDESIEDARESLDQREDELREFLTLDKVALPILQTQDDPDPNSARQQAINEMKEAARECYTNNRLSSRLKKQKHIFDKVEKRVSTLDALISKEQDQDQVRILKMLKELAVQGYMDTEKDAEKRKEFKDLRHHLQELSREIQFYERELVTDDSQNYPQRKKAIERLITLGRDIYTKQTIDDVQDAFDIYERAVQDFISFEEKIYDLKDNQAVLDRLTDRINQMYADFGSKPDFDLGVEASFLFEDIEYLKLIVIFAEKISKLANNVPEELCPARKAIVDKLNELLTTAYERESFQSGYLALSMGIQRTVGDLDHFITFDEEAIVVYRFQLSEDHPGYSTMEHGKKLAFTQYGNGTDYSAAFDSLESCLEKLIELIGLEKRLAEVPAKLDPFPTHDLTKEFPARLMAIDRLKSMISAVHEKPSLFETEAAIIQLTEGAQSFDVLKERLDELDAVMISILTLEDKQHFSYLPKTIDQLKHQLGIAYTCYSSNTDYSEMVGNIKSCVDQLNDLIALEEKLDQSTEFKEFPARYLAIDRLKMMARSAYDKSSFFEAEATVAQFKEAKENFDQLDTIANFVLDNDEGFPLKAVNQLKKQLDIAYTRPFVAQAYKELQENIDHLKRLHQLVKQVEELADNKSRPERQHIVDDLKEMARGYYGYFQYEAAYENLEQELKIKLGDFERFKKFDEYALGLLNLETHEKDSQNRKKAVSWIKEMVLAQYENKDHFVGEKYSDIKYEKAALDVIDAYIEKINEEYNKNKAARPVSIFYQSALRSARHYFDELYRDQHDDRDAFKKFYDKVHAFDRVFEQLEQIKTDPISSSRQKAMNSIRELAMAACQDPLKNERVFIDALKKYDNLCKQEDTNAVILSEFRDKIKEAFSDAFIAFSQDPIGYDVPEHIIQQTIDKIKAQKLEHKHAGFGRFFGRPKQQQPANEPQFVKPKAEGKAEEKEHKKPPVERAEGKEPPPPRKLIRQHRRRH